MSRALWLVPALALFAALGGGCGVKKPPVAAPKLLPQKVSPLDYHFSEEGLLVVSFKAPDQDIRGLPLKDLAGFIVEQSENKLRPGFCPGCPVEYTRRLHLKAKKPLGRKYVWEGEYEFEDLLEPGRVYQYRLYAHDSDGRYDPAQVRELVVYYDSPSRPPEALRVETADQLVTLSWPAPERLVDGRPVSELAGYDVYRRTGQGPWVKLNPGGPWDQTAFRDTRVKNGQTYSYKVRAVRRFRRTWIDGPPSPPVTAVPVDLTPPAPPVTLKAASVRGGISLSWSEVPARDLAGYRLYCRTQNQDRFHRVGPPLISSASFIHREVTPGQVYYYRVTAVDNSPAANESEPSQEVVLKFQP